METTHWADLAENFKIQDAACLMAGVPLAREMVAWSDKLPPEARYVFERLWKAYMRGAGVYKQPEADSADFQKMLHGIGGNDFEAPIVVPARGMIRRQSMLIAPSAELIRERLERVRVSRSELHRWVQATGIKSAYSFAPVATDPSPEQTDTPPVVTANTDPAPAQTATPAPVVVVEPASDGPTNRKRNWRDVSEAYLEAKFKQWQNPTVKDFYRLLKEKVGIDADSPFDKGTGQNLGSLFARDVGKKVTFKMIEEYVTELRKKM